MKRIVAMIMVLSMLLCSGAEVFAEGMENFSRKNTYDNTVFTDVGEDAWYYQNVADAYSYGLANGVGEGQFAPEGNVTVAQAITFAVRIYQIYHEGAIRELPSASDKWYDGYLAYAKEKGIVEENAFSSMEANATREEIAYIFSRILPDKEYEDINVTVLSIPDMKTADKCYNEILKLFKAGIITGMDDDGNYYPKRNVTRAEITAIIARVIDYKSRKKIDKTIGVPTPTPQPLDAQGIAEVASEGVVTVISYDEDGIEYSLGSGFFIDESGILVTNYHVVRDAYSAVVFDEELDKEYKVDKLLGCDEEKDIAILKVQSGKYKALKIGDSDKVKTGQKIFVIGSPKGFTNTISEGIVSNSKRENGKQILMQISAPISSGNSGGPVLNGNCEVVGIATSSFVSADSQNLNFAVHSNLIATVSQDSTYTLEEYQLKKIEDEEKSPVYYFENPMALDYGEFSRITAQSIYRDEDNVITYKYEKVGLFQEYCDAMVKLGWTLKSDTYKSKIRRIILEKDGLEIHVRNMATLVYVDIQILENNKVVYDENPSIPDYGYYTGQPLVRKIVEDDLVAYEYALNEKKIDRYVEHIYRHGFIFRTSEARDFIMHMLYRKAGEALQISKGKETFQIIFYIRK